MHHLYDLRDTMSFHWFSSASHTTLTWGKQRISFRGGKYSKHVSLLTYLAWLQPIINNSKLIFKHGFKIKDALLVVRVKKDSGHINQQLWINSHFNQLPKIIIKQQIIKSSKEAIYFPSILFQGIISISLLISQKLLTLKKYIRVCHHYLRFCLICFVLHNFPGEIAQREKMS